MTTFTSRPTFTSSTSVPPGTPPPSPPPGGPTGPQPTGPGRLVADVERQLSGPLHQLAAAVLDLDGITAADRAHLNAAANHISCALNRLARVDSRPPGTPGGEGPASGPGVHGGASGTRPGAGFQLPVLRPAVPDSWLLP